jgi:epoxyqueuosine reductase QueG
VDKRILESAKSGLDTDKLNRTSKCVVCGSACPAESAEGLCWVCRRLKISAWRDSDQQAAAQE